jgi:hypothetical protein
MRIRSLVAFLPKSNLPKPSRHPSFPRFSNQSHGTLRLARSARNQGVGCILAVENIDHRESRLIGPAWEEAITSIRDPARRIPSPRPEQPMASWATISVIIVAPLLKELCRHRSSSAGLRAAHQTRNRLFPEGAWIFEETPQASRLAAGFFLFWQGGPVRRDPNCFGAEDGLYLSQASLIASPKAPAHH